MSFMTWGLGPQYTRVLRNQLATPQQVPVIIVVPTAGAILADAMGTERRSGACKGAYLRQIMAAAPDLLRRVHLLWRLWG